MTSVERLSFGLSPSPPPFQPFDPSSIDVLKFDSLHIEGDLIRSQESRTDRNALKTSAYIQVQTSSDPLSESTNVAKWSDSSTAKGSGTEFIINTYNDDSGMQQNKKSVHSLNKDDKVKSSLPIEKAKNVQLGFKSPSQNNKASEKANSLNVEVEKKEEARKKRKNVGSLDEEGQRPHKRVNVPKLTTQAEGQKPLQSPKQNKSPTMEGKDGDHDKQISPTEAKASLNGSQTVQQRPNDRVNLALNSKTIAPLPPSRMSNQAAKQVAETEISKDIESVSTQAKESIREKATYEHSEKVNGNAADGAMPKITVVENATVAQDMAEQDTTMEEFEDDYPLQYVDDPPVTSSPSKAFASLDLNNEQEKITSRAELLTTEKFKSSAEPLRRQKNDTAEAAPRHQAKEKLKQSKQQTGVAKSKTVNVAKPPANSKVAKKLSEEEIQKRLEDRRFGVFHSDDESAEDEIEFVSMSKISNSASTEVQKRPAAVKKEGYSRPKPIPRVRSNTQNSEEIVNDITSSAKSKVQHNSATSAISSTKRKDAPVELDKLSSKRSRNRARHSVLDSIQAPIIDENKSLAEGAMEAYGFLKSSQKLKKGVPAKKPQQVQRKESIRDAKPTNGSNVPMTNSTHPKNDSIDESYDLDAILDNKDPKPPLKSTSLLTPLEDVQREDGEISSAIDSDFDESNDILIGSTKSKKMNGRGVSNMKAGSKKLLKTDDALQLLPGNKAASKGKFTDLTAAAKRTLQMEYSQEQSQGASKKTKGGLVKGDETLTPLKCAKNADDEEVSGKSLNVAISQRPPQADAMSQNPKKGTLGTTLYGRQGQSSMKVTPSAGASSVPNGTKPSQSPKKPGTKTGETTATNGKASTPKKRGRPPKKILSADNARDDDDDLYMVPPGKPINKKTKKTLRGKKAQQNPAMSPAVLHENNELREKFMEVDAFNIPEEQI